MFAQQPLLLMLLYLTLAFLLRMRFQNRFTASLMVMVMLCCSFVLARDYHREIRNALQEVRAAVSSPFRQPQVWPPKAGEPFPDLMLYDQDGNLVQLSSLKGKILLIEPVGMSCPACVAFSGGALYGPFEGVAPQPNLEPIDAYLSQFGAVDFNDDRLVFVQLLLFDRDLSIPTVEDARRWAHHFRFERAQQKYVLVGDTQLWNDASRAIIPGFYLVDQDFVVRADSTGAVPKHDLYTYLIPLLHDLLEEDSTGSDH